MKNYVLRVCRADGSSYNGFKWPLEVGATVTAPDWKPTKECGNGLHGWLHGAGAYDTCQHFGLDAKWLVVEIVGDYIDLDGKVKFRDGVVRFVGDSKSAADYLWEVDPESRSLPVIGAHRADMRDGAVVIVGAHGHAAAGDRGTSTSGYRGTSTSGDGGTSTSGDEGTSTSGDWGTSTSGYRGTAAAGEGGSISILYADGNRYRRKSADVGEGGLKPNVKYRIENGQFVEAK